MRPLGTWTTVIVLFCVFFTWPLATAQARTGLGAAVELWLQGNDEESLPALAELAQSGDRTARILLGRLETQDLGPSPYRVSLSRAERRALFRDMRGSGVFGKSWLRVEAQNGFKLAGYFLRSRQPKPNLPLIKKLWDAGERQATDYPSRIVALYGTPQQQKTLVNSQRLLRELTPFLAYLMDEPEPRGDGLAALRVILGDNAPDNLADDSDALGMAGFLALGFGFGDMSPENAYRDDIEDWLLSSWDTRPIADLCLDAGPDKQGACAFAFFALSGGYFEAIRMDTPYQSLIPQRQFLTSPRARLMTLRRAALARAETNTRELASISEIAELSEYAAELVAAERQKYK